MALVKNFSLDPTADRDIIAFFEKQPNQSAAFREVVRYYLAREEGVTLADVLAEIRALPSRLRVVSIAEETTGDGGQEPEEAAANLDSLLPRLEGGAID